MSSDKESIIKTDKIVSDKHLSDGIHVQSESSIKPINNSI